jgi:hypothetical protein
MGAGVDDEAMAAGMAAGWPCRDEGSATAVAGGGRAAAERRCSDAAKGARRPGALKRDGGCGEAGESVFHSAKFAMRRAGQRRGGRGETEAGTEGRRHLREEYKESRAEARGPPRPRQGRHDGRRGPVRSTHTCPLSLWLDCPSGSHWHWATGGAGTGGDDTGSLHAEPTSHPPASIHPPVAGEG